ncbi:MAG: beta-propeller fold lactonase family protein [Spirochaetota bacterium]
MKTLFKILMALFALTFAGCGDTYNDVLNDLEEEYKYFLAIFNSPNAGGRYISTFSLNSDGALSPAFESTDYSAAGTYPDAHPNGKYLYGLISDTAKLNVYTVSDEGILSLSSTADTGTYPYVVKVHPSGKYVYVSNSSGYSISMYIVNADGTLTSNGTLSIGSPYRPRRMSFHPSGNYLYVAIIYPTWNASYFSSFSVNNDGTLTPVESLVEVITGTPSITTFDIAVHPNGQFLYVTQSNADIYKYKIENDGTTSAKLNAGSSGSSNVSLAIHPNGNYLYAIGYNILTNYQINQTDGTLSSISGFIATGENEAVVHPNGKYLYKTDYSNSAIQCYTINGNGSIDNSNMISYQITDYIYYPSHLVLFRKKSG